VGSAHRLGRIFQAINSIVQYFNIPMSTQVTITLPDEVYQRAQRFAHLANRDVASVLADSILLSIPSVREEALMLAPVFSLGDDEVQL
jgi:hypothetical protein